MWEFGEKDTAIEILQDWYAKHNNNIGADWKLIIAAQLVEWFKDFGFDYPENITTQYLEPVSITYPNSKLSLDKKAKLLHSLADFCILQFNNKLRNERLERLKKLRKDKLMEIEALQELHKQRKLEGPRRNMLIKASKVLDTDELEIKELLTSKNEHLLLGATLYLQAAKCSDETGDNISKFMAVWFQNINETKLNNGISDIISEVPAILLVPWINQLSSRLGETSQSYSINLETMIEMACSSHPFHSLYTLKSLMTKPSNGKFTTESDRSRYYAGEKMWAKLKRYKFLVETLDSVSNFCDVCLNVSRVPVPKTATKCSLDKVTTPRHWWKKIKHLSIPVPTRSIPLRADCNYSSIPRMTLADDTVSIASGLSHPKIIRLQSSDGKWDTMLIKGGNDDMRQDAIMEQVFSQVNIFFQKRDFTKERRLFVRTYTVIPLGKNGGIIEFVPNTISFMDYLSSAHKKYRPNDMDLKKARQRLAAAKSLPSDKKLAEYNYIASKLKPVLHMFFFDYFYSVDLWFESKMRYIRSTAAISILGYVLGIGDRHCSNILLDYRNGDVVHIDLGIAFDQVCVCHSHFTKRL